MSHGLRRLPIALFCSLVPRAERDEVGADLEAEYRERASTHGAISASRWLWTQLLRSLPALVARSWHRGSTGFDPRANAMNPGGPLMERWILETRYAARRLRTRPTYTLLAVVTLALGVGGMATISGIARSLLVNPLPYPDDRQLVQFWAPGDWRANEFAALRDQWSGFTAVAAYRSKDVTMEHDGDATRLVPGIASSTELFRALGVAPLLGQGFAAGDDGPVAAQVAVLSYKLWRELGADPAIIGTPLKLDGVSRTVIGVMPRGFWFPDPSISIWTPEPIDPTRGYGIYTLVGRIAPGHRVEQMQAVIDRVTRLLAARFTYSPQWDKTKNAVLTPLRDELVGGMRPALFATLAGLGAILLIACANVAALVLSQVESRSGELAVRAALGADRGRLITQLAIEVVVLGLLAGALGTCVAVAGFDVLRGALALGVWSDRATLDWTLFAIAMAVAVLAALGIALLPMMAVWRSDLRVTLGGARTGGVLRKRGGLQGAMVVGEVALAVLLACGAGLLSRSVAKLYAIRPGFETRGIAVLDIAIPTSLGTNERHLMLRNVIRDISALPGVQSVAVTQKAPLRGRGWTMGMRTVDESADLPSPYFRMVSPGYFATLGVPVRVGRGFDGSQRETDSVSSIVVNEALVKIYFPTVDPVGQQFPGGFDRKPERIVAVVANIAEGKLTDQMAPTRYYLADQVSFVPDGQTIVIRTAEPGYAEHILPAARRVVGKTAPSVAVQDVTTMGRVFDSAVGPARQVMTLLALLTGLALLLGAIGIYGVISQFVARRRREWSIRVALGLTPSRVIRLVVGHGMVLVATGIALGVGASLALARLLTTFLYGVSPTDPLTLAGAMFALFAVGVAAALIPAMRAGRADPALVLREQ